MISHFQNMMSVKRDLVQKAIWGRELSREEADRASRGLTERRFPKGSYICRKGEKLDYWTGVTHGLVKVSLVSEKGEAATFMEIRPGGWFGEGSLLKDEARKYDAVALYDSRVSLLNKATVSGSMKIARISTGFWCDC
jgi:CRP-like cAMP-binding protein